MKIDSDHRGNSLCLLQHEAVTHLCNRSLDMGHDHNQLPDQVGGQQVGRVVQPVDKSIVVMPQFDMSSGGCNLDVKQRYWGLKAPAPTHFP